MVWLNTGFTIPEDAPIGSNVSIPGTQLVELSRKDQEMQSCGKRCVMGGGGLWQTVAFPVCSVSCLLFEM